jgi:hypothetical protein
VITGDSAVITGDHRRRRVSCCAMVGLDVGRLMGYEMVQGVP